MIFKDPISCDKCKPSEYHATTPPPPKLPLLQHCAGVSGFDGTDAAPVPTVNPA